MLYSLGARALPVLTPLYLVGSYDRNNQPNIMAAAWGGVCASQPPCMAVSLRKATWSHDALLERKAFTLNLPSRSLLPHADYAGIVSGRDVPKFETLGLTPLAADHVDAPYIKECPVVLELTLRETHTIGSHTQFVGEIMDVKVAAHCLAPDNSIRMDCLDLVLYAPMSKEYWGGCSFAAKAFSVGKKMSEMRTPDQD